MLRLLALTAAAALGATPAAAQTVWAAAPTTADVAAAFPDKAKAAGVGGAATLMCTVSRDGRMKDCDILGEAPRGQGFGVAARRLAEAGMRASGVPKDTELTVDLSFPVELAKGEPLNVKTPIWTALPSVTEIQTAVPKTEGAANNARVTLVCEVQAGGLLSGCVVDREEPAGQGFGPAILTLAPKFKVGLISAEGMPTVGGKVRVPVRFDLKPVAQAAK